MSKIIQPERLRRRPICAAGRLVYEGHVDQDKLQCLYCCVKCTICKRETAARRSYIDVYTNGIMVNVPTVTCCFFMTDHTTLVYWDDPRINNNNMGKASCCKPAPHCCPHCCNCCGEVYYFYRCVGVCPPQSSTMGLGHTGLCVPLICLCCPASCCVTDLFCGLAADEAEKLDQMIQRARFGFYSLIEYPPLFTMRMGEPISPKGASDSYSKDQV